MLIFIQTSNKFKFKELEKYFKDISLSATWLKPEDKPIQMNESSIIIQEQTQLLNQDGATVSLNTVESCTHYSTITMTQMINGEIVKKDYKAQVEGFVFPFLKTKDEEVYSWDDIFVSKNTHQTNHELKKKGVKNSARDLAFSHLIQDLKDIFYLKEPINLNFNPSSQEEVISFEPFIQEKCQTEPLLKLAYHNNFFNPLLNTIFNEGLFIRSAKTRQQKNYWSPGINAGIPLTPKKDTIHELTFMFHDLMHFLFPDLIITKDDEKNRKVYLIARMMSEAFTLILADTLYIDLLVKNAIPYDFEKRKIYPLFKHAINKTSIDNLDTIISLLKTHAKFALLGEEYELEKLDRVAFHHYKDKYQTFFNKDYIWTNENYQYLSKQVSINKTWLNSYKHLLKVESTEDFSKNLHSTQTQDVFNYVFEKFSHKLKESLKTANYNELDGLKNSYKKFMAGQMMIFHKQQAHYNSLFEKNILQLFNILDEALSIDEVKVIFQKIKDCYDLYINTLNQDKLISPYKAEQYKSMYPLFDPFFVFYERKGEPTFHETLTTLFEDLK